MEVNPTISLPQNQVVEAQNVLFELLLSHFLFAKLGGSKTLWPTTDQVGKQLELAYLPCGFLVLMAGIKTQYRVL